MASTAIHYDCDPGQDDAIALLYALGSQTIDVKTISVVGGNTDVAQCARNTLQILELAGRDDIEVYLGADKPLVRKLKTLPEVFGITGMAGAEDLPLPKKTAVNVNIDQQLANIVNGKTIVATGPLTNLALQIQNNPDFVSSIDHLYLMGGCVYPEPVHQRIGNIKVEGTEGYAEYNFACDPEAAKIVFSAGFKKITMVGLDVTRSVLYGWKTDEELRKLRTKCAVKSADILAAVGEEDLEDYRSLWEVDNDPVRAMHDILAMASLDDESLFTFEMLPIRIAVGAPPVVSGQTLIDHENPDHPSVRVAVGIDKDRFLKRVTENIARLP